MGRKEKPADAENATADFMPFALWLLPSSFCLLSFALWLLPSVLEEKPFSDVNLGPADSSIKAEALQK